MALKPVKKSAPTDYNEIDFIKRPDLYPVRIIRITPPVPEEQKWHDLQKR